jgi:dTMP kinase
VIDKRMKCPIPGGFLLAIEGLDGAGKSVQVEAVSKVLKARGLEVALTREPTGGHWGKKLRESAAAGRLSPRDELHAFMEDRKEHVRDVLRPNLHAGKIVITDRYYFSTVAYQGARGFEPADLLRRNEAFAIEPHLLVLIDVDPETGLARIGHRSGMTDDFETVAQLAKCREIFLSLRKPYLVRIEGRARPNDIRDEILVAFSRAAVAIIAACQTLTPRQKLDAIQDLHGAPPLAD